MRCEDCALQRNALSRLADNPARSQNGRRIAARPQRPTLRGCSGSKAQLVTMWRQTTGLLVTIGQYRLAY
jgi:hypothetical protein